MSLMFDDLRRKMVEIHIIPRGIKNELVINTMRKIPREKFVPEYIRNNAYDDVPLPIGEGQTISQPYIVAKMLELIEPEKKDRVLEIGTGSGYQTALLAEMCSMVVTIEKIKTLYLEAKKRLEGMNYTNIIFVYGDGTIGYSEFAPYDKIIVSAGAPDIPKSLFSQLKEGGIIVIPVGDRFFQTLVKVTKINGKMVIKECEGCSFVPLLGKEGWNNGA
jgi:protein-L-isoaspartate(D-aspartate) O-methyltransferase